MVDHAPRQWLKDLQRVKPSHLDNILKVFLALGAYTLFQSITTLIDGVRQ
jgi:hypothetical protein